MGFSHPVSRFYFSPRKKNSFFWAKKDVSIVSWRVLMCLDVSPRVLSCLEVSWRVLTCLHVSWRVLTCLDVSWRVLTFLDVYWHVLACIDVYWRVLTSQSEKTQTKKWWTAIVARASSHRSMQHGPTYPYCWALARIAPTSGWLETPLKYFCFCFIAANLTQNHFCFFLFFVMFFVFVLFLHRATRSSKSVGCVCFVFGHDQSIQLSQKKPKKWKHKKKRHSCIHVVQKTEMATARGATGSPVDPCHLHQYPREHDEQKPRCDTVPHSHCDLPGIDQ